MAPEYLFTLAAKLLFMTYTLLGYLVPSAIFLFYVYRYEGRDLKNKFKRLGDLSGLKKEQIIAKAGKPNTIFVARNDMQVLQWRRNGFQIAIKFDKEDNFRGISQES